MSGRVQALPNRRRRTVHGSSHQHVSPNRAAQPPHAAAKFLLKNPLGAVLGAPCDVYLDELNVFQPDVLHVSAGHASRILDDGIHGAPDLVIEILSPSTATLDRRKRSPLAKAGAVEFWQIDPALRQLQRFVFAENIVKPVALIDEPEAFASPLFPGLALATPEMFRR